MCQRRAADKKRRNFMFKVSKKKARQNIVKNAPTTLYTNSVRHPNLCQGLLTLFIRIHIRAKWPKHELTFDSRNTRTVEPESTLYSCSIHLCLSLDLYFAMKKN